MDAPSSIDEARMILYSILTRLCKLRKASIIVLPTHRGCNASLRGSSIRLVISSLETRVSEACLSSLMETSVSAKVRILNTALSLIIGVLGTLIIAGTKAGLIASIAALVIGAASWLQGETGPEKNRRGKRGKGDRWDNIQSL